MPTPIGGHSGRRRHQVMQDAGARSHVGGARGAGAAAGRGARRRARSCGAVVSDFGHGHRAPGRARLGGFCARGDLALLPPSPAGSLAWTVAPPVSGLPGSPAPWLPGVRCAHFVPPISPEAAGIRVGTTSPSSPVALVPCALARPPAPLHSPPSPCAPLCSLQVLCAPLRGWLQGQAPDTCSSGALREWGNLVWNRSA